ncbi:MAG TPA: hypothetical protein VIU61_11225 [Kofleriaceae bacterium]
MFTTLALGSARADVNDRDPTPEERKRALAETGACLRAEAKRELAADRLYAAGKYPQALAEYRAATGCEGTSPTKQLLAKTALAACRTGDATTAKKIYGDLLHAYRRGLVPICAASKVTLRAARPSIPDTLDRDMIGETLEPVRDAIVACHIAHTPPSPIGGHQTQVRGVVDASGKVLEVHPGGHPAAEPCVTAVVKAVQFPVTKSGGSFSVRFYVDPSSANADRAEAHSIRWARAGKLVDAVRQYEFVLDNQPKQEHIERAYLMACKAKLVADATVFSWRLDPKRLAKLGSCP